MPPPAPDAADVRLALAGDAEAYGRLYDRHAAGVRAVVAAAAGDFDAIEDLTQEAFLRGYRRLATLRDAAGFGPWVHGIARMVAREWRRKRLSDAHVEFDEGHLAASAETGAVVQRDEQRRALAALAELPERERLAVHAYYFSDRNADEAADALGLSRSGYYAALERGMRRLRLRLGAAEQSPPSARTGP